MNDILIELETIARYDGPWAPLKAEAALLRDRLRELREREARLNDVLVVALVGGSGVGKSTLLNAIAGDRLADVSEFRPCTAVPTVYHPPGAKLDFPGWRMASGSALENLVLIDTPDSDTIVKEHRSAVIDALAQCDLILMCGSPEKYMDEATWSLLRPLQGERTLVCVETKADAGAESIRDHWMNRLAAQGFRVDACFRVCALRAFESKLRGAMPGPDAFDFARLESFLREELTRERIRRIKSSNTAGLLAKTISTLNERVAARRPEVETLLAKLHTIDQTVVKETYGILRRRLFSESHLWTFALGRETSIRSKGIVGTLFRILEAVRTLPARVAGWLPKAMPLGAGRQAAALLTENDLFNEDIDVASEAVHAVFRSARGEAVLEMSKAHFATESEQDSFKRFSEAVRQRLTALLRGPARDRIVARARVLASWPVTLLMDAAPLTLLGYIAYHVVYAFFQGITFSKDDGYHAMLVLLILIALEMLALSIAVRLAAWRARAKASTDLRIALGEGGLAFRDEQEAAREVIAEIDRVQYLHGMLSQEGRKSIP
ncbi:MAG: ABC transporter [Candidatus Hydrogenedentota bacterium]